MNQQRRETEQFCPRCKNKFSSDIDGEVLAWTYRRDVLGANWPCLPGPNSAICYLCYVREVLQWAKECA